MYRFLAVLLVPVVVAAVAPAAPVPKLAGKGETRYYPTTLGAKWVYTDASGDDVLVISKVEEVKGAKVVTVERVEGEKRFPFEKVRVSEGGVARVAIPQGEFDPPLVLLSVPFKVGDAWTYRGAGAGTLAQQRTSAVFGSEKVTVPAGTFDAVRVDAEYTIAFGQATVKHSCSFWYAPGVGLVKMKDGNAERVLKSFTPGKE